jgi:hypothetical protein
MRAAAAAVAVLAVAASACGGSSAERPIGHFGDYRVAQEERGRAERALNQAFRELTQGTDRVSVVAAAERGRTSVARIRRLLDREIEAATAIAAYEPAREHARALAKALRRSGEGLRPLEELLAIAIRDPFLDQPANANRVSRLSAETVRLSVSAAFARRRAAHAVALSLGVEPPVDVMFDFPTRG